MSFGIIEVITLLLGMAGFGLQPNPKAPTADQSLQYALSDADIVVHIDAASIIPGNYKLLGQLADQPQIKASPELQKLVRQAIGEIEGARGAAALATDIDVTKDIADATAFFRMVPNADPNFVIAVHGKFSAKNLDKIANVVGTPAAQLAGGMIVETGRNDPAIALTKDGVMLVGNTNLVRDRLAAGWRPPSHDAGSNLGYLADAINAKPVFAVVVTMSPAARSELTRHLGPRNFATDLIMRHKAAAFSIFHDGIGWTWVDNSKAGIDAMELVSNGVLDVLRAAQIAPRGIAKIAMGALDSYRGANAQVDDLIRHKADIMKIIDTYTGDGAFKATVDKNPKTLRLTVRATGKTVSEVMPFGLVLPGAVAGFLMFRAEAQAVEAPPPVMVEPSRPPPGKPPGPKPPAPKPPAGRPPAGTPPSPKP